MSTSEAKFDAKALLKKFTADDAVCRREDVHTLANHMKAGNLTVAACARAFGVIERNGEKLISDWVSGQILVRGTNAHKGSPITFTGKRSEVMIAMMMQFAVDVKRATRPEVRDMILFSISPDRSY